MVKELTLQEIVALVAQVVADEGSQAAAARRIGVSPSFLGEVLRGTREPGPTILKFLGIERQTIYRKK